MTSDVSDPGNAPSPTPDVVASPTAAAPKSKMSVNLRNALVLALTTVLIVAVVVLVKQPWRQSDPNVTPVSVTTVPGQAAPQVGGVARDFTAQTITGETVKLSSLRGKPVWLVFGATWCPSCRAEVADIQALSAQYAGKINLVGVYVQEDQPTVSDYASRMGLTYTQIADQSDAISAAYAVSGVPVHFFIDAQGVIRGIEIGGLAKADMTSHLDALLAG